MTDKGKIVSDRHIPLRKLPKSAKELYAECRDWDEEETAMQNEKKGFTVADMFKMEVLGEGTHNNKDSEIQSFSNSNLLKFHEDEKDDESVNFSSKGYIHFEEENFPAKTQQSRKINKLPTKVLDAPALYDDFYLNLVDWSSNNLLAVGLSNSVYIWNATNSKVAKLVELGDHDLVTSNSSSPSSNILAVGTHSGEVQLWDCQKIQILRTFKGHTGRIGAISWNNNNILASGSRDKNILTRDIRTSDDYISKMCGHKQEICGLKWSFDGQQLASGGNDNRLNLWSLRSTFPTATFLKHSAAVKALAWSPHQHGLLVSGGGTADRTIRFWNTVSGD